jgi:hypothetical protein
VPRDECSAHRDRRGPPPGIIRPPVRPLDGIGITLAAASPSASAVIDVASTAGDWATLPTARLLALDLPAPLYVPVPPGTRAATRG